MSTNSSCAKGALSKAICQSKGAEPILISLLAVLGVLLVIPFAVGIIMWRIYSHKLKCSRSLVDDKEDQIRLVKADNARLLAYVAYQRRHLKDKSEWPPITPQQEAQILNDPEIIQLSQAIKSEVSVFYGLKNPKDTHHNFQSPVTGLNKSPKQKSRGVSIQEPRKERSSEDSDKKDDKKPQKTKSKSKTNVSNVSRLDQMIQSQQEFINPLKNRFQDPKDASKPGKGASREVEMSGSEDLQLVAFGGFQAGDVQAFQEHERRIAKQHKSNLAKLEKQRSANFRKDSKPSKQDDKDAADEELLTEYEDVGQSKKTDLNLLSGNKA